MRSAPRFGAVQISSGCADDLKWFLAVLHFVRLHSIPLERFTVAQEPTIHVHMDASDSGLCILLPVAQEFIQIQFSQAERDLIRESERGSNAFCINVRELMNAVFTSIVLGNRWSPSSGNRQHHVRFWIDNMAAVAWNNRRASHNPFAQLLLRILALKEVEYDFYSAAAHIAGVDNIMADAGSRIWLSSTMAEKFTNLSRGWTQVAVPVKCRNLWQLWGQFCANLP
ncbi:hypothetical protein PF003_g7142 [Phytophthora fragariae]|nr:hypothetical protein PF003_g7142 [Phytophthora fragariae]